AATVFIVLMVGLATDADFRPLLVLFAGGVVASLHTYGIRKRTRLLQVGLVTGLAHVVTIYGVGIGQAEGLAGLQAVSGQAVVGMLNGLLVGVIITGLLPFLEPLFRITTDISLLELGDLNQPVLKSFALRAPGSYNHSLTVGVLAEAAARAIGADDLLARVGSYFHDIGKINKPHYFVENQGDQGSRHDTLSPRMSALVITAHAKDGLELGRELGLPRPILDVIAEHHGTTLVEFFYKRACMQAGDDDPPDEHLFRYVGPKPRSKESAIVMLADSVESASRVLSDPTPARIGNLVHQITGNKLADGQLEECNLTLRELHGIETSLTKGLTSIFHGRIKY
ncbi:MAG TPA: HDIG domain-containing protein, partial [Planctomycetota bacterium]|nr:HDIG domain-containing protein [Planctomycetota bacterium]